MTNLNDLVGTALDEAYPGISNRAEGTQRCNTTTVGTSSTNVLTKGHSEIQNEHTSLDSTDNSEISVKAIDPSAAKELHSIDSKRMSLSKKIVEYRLYLEQLENERKYVESQLNVFQKQLNETKESIPVVNSNSPLGTQEQNINSSMIRHSQNFPFFIGPTGEQSESIMSILFYIFLVLFGYLLAYRLKK